MSDTQRGLTMRVWRPDGSTFDLPASAFAIGEGRHVFMSEPLKRAELVRMAQALDATGAAIHRDPVRVSPESAIWGDCIQIRIDVTPS
jgi:hypothetical protein